MEKKVKQFSVSYPLDWTYGVEISKIRADLDAIEKLGATHINIEPEMNYDSPSVEIWAVSERIETEAEYGERIAKHNKEQEEIKRREIEQLKRLQNKYKL